MNLHLGLPRLTVAVAGIPLVVVFATACGSSGSFTAGDGGAADGHAGDGASSGGQGADGALEDGALQDGESDAHVAAGDAETGVTDGGPGAVMQSLGTAGSFVVLGGAEVTNSGIATVLMGDVGTTGPTVTGLTGPPFQPSGNTQVNNAVATQAVLDLGTAYNALSGEACPAANHLTGIDLGGMTLAPGVYCFTSSAGQIAGTTLTFDAKGDPNAVWVIQVATALTVMNNATAVVIGGPPSLACRIFWTTGTAATLNGGVHFLGNVLASSQTSMLTDTTLSPGRAFGITSGVTLLSNTVSATACP